MATVWNSVLAKTVEDYHQYKGGSNEIGFTFICFIDFGMFLFFLHFTLVSLRRNTTVLSMMLSRSNINRFNVLQILGLP